jgi:DNA transposition AAA+ family ATPase
MSSCLASSYVPPSGDFIVTKEHRRFVEFCDACRRSRYIGLCHGVPGVGKTVSAYQYAQWDLLGSPASYYLPAAAIPRTVVTERTIVYTPSVNNMPRQIERTVVGLRRRLNALAARAHQTSLFDEPSTLQHTPDLIIVDEADRLKMAGLEQMRDLYDRGRLGLVLIGMPGLEKRLARYAQLQSRVGFVHQFRTLSIEEMQFILAHKWQQLGLHLTPDDFTDAEAVAAITRITAGNFRLIQRLFEQIDRILQINNLRTVTKEVVEAARETLVVGLL